MITTFCIVILCMAGNRVSCQCNGTTQIIPVGYESISFKSPGYPNPGYGPNESCEWIACSAVGKKILLSVTNEAQVCSGDSLAVYEGSSSNGTLLADQCSSQSSDLRFHAASNDGTVYTKFTSDEDKTADEAGFIIYMISGDDFSGTGCDAEQQLTATDTPQYLSSPNFPLAYDKNLDCNWKIKTIDEPKKVYIKVEFLELESYANPDPGECYDYLEIKEGAQTTGKLCERTDINLMYNPAIDYTSTGNTVSIVFRSDGSRQFHGFLLSYRQIDSGTIVQSTAGSDSTQNVTSMQCQSALATLQDTTTMPSSTEALTTEATTEAVTTEATTEAVTTEATTEAVTTEATTEAVTTEATTEAVTTEATTEAVTTEAVTTEATTEAVTTEAVTTEATTEAMTTEATTEAVTTEATTEAVTTEAKTDAMTTDTMTTRTTTKPYAYRKRHCKHHKH